MHLYDPYGELHAKRQRLDKFERQYQAWCVVAMLATVALLVMWR